MTFNNLIALVRGGLLGHPCDLQKTINNGEIGQLQGLNIESQMIFTIPQKSNKPLYKLDITGPKKTSD